MKPEKVGNPIAAFLSRFVSLSPAGEKEAGLELAQNGAVEVFKSSLENRVLALVFEDANHPELIRFHWQKRTPVIEVACTCAVNAQWRACPHVWAALTKIAGHPVAAIFPVTSLHLRGSRMGSSEYQELLALLRTASPRLKSLSMLPTATEPAAAPPPPSPPPALPPPDVPAQRSSFTDRLKAKKGKNPEAPGRDWRQALKTLQPVERQQHPAKPRLIFYSIDAYNRYSQNFKFSFWVREMRQDGSWGVLKPQSIELDVLADLPAEERLLVKRLIHADPDIREQQSHRNFEISPVLLAMLVRELAATGRFGAINPEDKEFVQFDFDDGGPWRLVFEGRDERGDLSLHGLLRRGEETLQLKETAFVYGGLFLHHRKVAELESDTSDAWVATLKTAKPLVIPAAEVGEALAELATDKERPTVEFDAAWSTRIAAKDPEPALRLHQDPSGVLAQLLFVYGATEIQPDEKREILPAQGGKVLHRRGRGKEAELAARLPFRLDPRGFGAPSMESFPILLEELAAEGWRIGFEGKKVRTGGKFRLRVESGIDWFDVGGELDFGSRQQVDLPSLLAAAREGRSWVNLADGTVGLLPAGWTKRWAPLVELGKNKGGLRFGVGQALVLDHLLRDPGASGTGQLDPVDIKIDATFARIRERLRSFSRLEPAPEPQGFLGELRPYQRLGLAWLGLLADLQLGGCLADDMGLGKTVQVLAFLLSRKNSGAAGGKPSLLVVPRSLVFNWVAELERFTPQLTCHVSHGTSRAETFEKIREKDLVITTYGTLVRDVEKLKGIPFDVLLLDEAQAIKNRGTQAAEACRSLTAGLHLALSGTPVENHLGELWSIFEFLNPGLLGKLPRISEYAGRQKLPPEALAEVAQALRPLILRRKKSDVLKDLPPKTEQTLTCELSLEERKRYNELRRYYQASLKKKIADVGIEKSKIFVLEALLRLRQAACHPGLVDKRAKKLKSAKIELLLENLEQVLEEGHKALVFSQFTSLLDLVRQAIEARGWRYQYLDGATRDREARVQSFQTDPELRIFLISLKAGGVGLNLTAASYVFLLDPWWNPAVEAQAIDRTHRIGQEQPVFAYRIIAEDTVEEKILKLQDDKRALADAIVAEDQRVLKQLTAADLENLLG